MRTLLTLVVVWILLIVPSSLIAQSDIIEPADRVVHAVNVREAPSATSGLLLTEYYQCDALDCGTPSGSASGSCCRAECIDESCAPNRPPT